MDVATLNPALRDAALAGLTAHPKVMEPKWLYDEKGSRLFEEITVVPEYYPTRTERAILEARIDEIAAHVPAGAELIELGSGASVKTRFLLDHLDLASYRPMDISPEMLSETARDLAAAYPHLTVDPIEGDFTAPLALPPSSRARVGFFPGSTIGNLPPDMARTLLEEVRAWPEVESFVLGVDLVKDTATLKAAYDDAAGVTAAFNLNLLTRMNREIGANFDPAGFAHEARWNAEAARIEMHLVSQRAQRVRLAGTDISFAAGETIHTESSRKFTPESLAALAESAGWRIGAMLTDPETLFAVAVLVPAETVRQV